MSNGLEAIRIRVVNKDGNDDVQMWAWADSTVGAFKKRLGTFYKAQPGQINLVLQVGLERYVLARMHRLKVRSTVNSTIDGGCSNFEVLVQDGTPVISMWRVTPSWTGDTKLLHPSLMVIRIHGISKSRAMHSCQHTSFQPHRQEYCTPAIRTFGNRSRIFQPRASSPWTCILTMGRGDEARPAQ
jgi:hypothetical protein